MKKSLKYFIALLMVLSLTIGLVLLTRNLYDNAFLNEMKAIIIVFCIFLVIDVFRWKLRMGAVNNMSQSKKEEISWTISAVVCIVYFLWRTWRLYSLMQINIVIMLCIVLMLGLIVRLFSQWDVDSVRWITWSSCCLLLMMTIGISILVWKPMTVGEAEALVVVSTGDNSYEFCCIESSKSTEYPLGFYLFKQKQIDGSWSSDGRGRAIVYLGENQKAWRSPIPQE